LLLIANFTCAAHGRQAEASLQIEVTERNEILVERIWKTGPLFLIVSSGELASRSEFPSFRVNRPISRFLRNFSREIGGLAPKGERAFRAVAGRPAVFGPNLSPTLSRVRGALGDLSSIRYTRAWWVALRQEERNLLTACWCERDQ
jgi:hypothetical protein